MHSVERPFTVEETHGPLRQPGVQTRTTSGKHGWTSLYASLQREAPFEGRFNAVDDQLIVLHLDGPVSVHRRIVKGEDSRIIPAGGMFMVPGGMDFGVRLEGELQTLHLYLRRALMEEVADEIAPGDPTHIETLPRFGGGDPLIERLMLGIGDALHDEASTATPYVDYLTRAIAAHLIRRHSSLSTAAAFEHVSQQLAKARLDKAIDFIESNLDHSIDLTAIASAAGLSPGHFARQFRASIGMAPHQFLMQRRVEHAQRKLGETSATIADIAYGCGFANQEHLTRLFKRICGVTPAVYRRTRRE